MLWHLGGDPRTPPRYVQLLPRLGVGLFVSITSDEFGFLDQVLRAFNDHYYPLADQTPPQQVVSGREQDLTLRRRLPPGRRPLVSP